MTRLNLGTIPTNSNKVLIVNLSGDDAFVHVAGKKEQGFSVYNGQTIKLNKDGLNPYLGCKIMANKKVSMLVTLN